MKNYLVSMLLLVACVCASCEPIKIKGEIDKVNLSKEDTEKLDAIFQYVKETQVYDILSQDYEKHYDDEDYSYYGGLAFMVKSEQELRELAPVDMELPKIDFANHSLVWCVFRSSTSQTNVESFRLIVDENGEATAIVRHRTASFDCMVGEHCTYAVFDIPSNTINKISSDVKHLR